MMCKNQMQGLVIKLRWLDAYINATRANHQLFRLPEIDSFGSLRRTSWGTRTPSTARSGQNPKTGWSTYKTHQIICLKDDPKDSLAETLSCTLEQWGVDVWVWMVRNCTKDDAWWSAELDLCWLDKGWACQVSKARCTMTRDKLDLRKKIRPRLAMCSTVLSEPILANYDHLC